MIFDATQEIYDRFESEQLNCVIRETESLSLVEISVVCNSTSIQMRFISSSPTTGVCLRVDRVARFPEEKFEAIVPMLNELNAEYRYVKFIPEREDHAVDLLYDFPRCTEDNGETAMEMFNRVPSIVDEVYPRLMRKIWGGK